MKKKLLILLLGLVAALCCALAFSACSSSNDGSENNGGDSDGQNNADDKDDIYSKELIFELTDYGMEYIVTGLSDKTVTEIIIPNEYNGLPVTYIDVDAFIDCSELTIISIPDSVVHIGAGAFRNTAWYENQPDGLVYAGKVAYRYKGAISENTSITIADGTKGIAVSAFENCRRLSNITISDSVTSIGRYAFRDCIKLTDINFNGAKEQWKAIEKGNDWDGDTNNYTVHCTDGDLSKEEA